MFSLLKRDIQKLQAQATGATGRETFLPGFLFISAESLESQGLKEWLVWCHLSVYASERHSRCSMSTPNINNARQQPRARSILDGISLSRMKAYRSRSQRPEGPPCGLYLSHIGKPGVCFVKVSSNIKLQAQGRGQQGPCFTFIPCPRQPLRAMSQERTRSAYYLCLFLRQALQV